MKSVFLGFVIVLVLIVVCGSAQAYYAPAFTVDELLTQSTVVVVGRIADIGPGVAQARRKFSSRDAPTYPPVPVWVRPAAVDAVSVLKGQGLKPGNWLRVLLTEQRGNCPGWDFPHYAIDEHRLFFLEQTKDGLEPTEPLWVRDATVLPDGVLLSPVDGTPLEEAERLFARALQGYCNDPPRVKEILRVLYPFTRAARPASVPPVLKTGPADQELRFTTRDLLQAVVLVLDSADSTVREKAARLLCSVGYVPALERMAAIIRAKARAGQDVGGTMCGIEVFHNPQGLSELHRLLFDPEVPALRQGAAFALANIKSERSLSLLIRALADAEPDVRWEVAASLARMTGLYEHVFNRDEFKANEAAEIEFWSSWWNANASRFTNK